MSKDAASLLGWFGKRKEGVVNDGLRAMFLSVQDCVTELGLAMRAMGDSDPASAQKAIERLFQCEHEADAQEDELCNQISLGELGAQEREDLMHFIRKTDKIANWSKEAAISVKLVEEIGLEVPREIWDMLAQVVSDLESEVRNLSNAVSIMGVEGADVMECVRGVRDLERTIDRSYFDITKAIFKSDMDSPSIIMMSRIVEAIEMAADTCKGCSDTVAILHFAKKV
ncbi:DUF47 domain-containing protein [Candidatus Methanoprimaticola sp. MG2]|uniref:DUF47 domain-containing protein n=1 Tax=Candidatus Methanoprimaticola sp. MG2 TaxID=3228838 RepID=UPI0039C5B5AB